MAALQARLEDLTVQLEKMEMDIKKFTTNTSRVNSTNCLFYIRFSSHHQQTFFGFSNVNFNMRNLVIIIKGQRQGSLHVEMQLFCLDFVPHFYH